MAVVAISRQFGSAGARVGRAVAHRLGFQYADREILAEAARLLQVNAADLEPLEEHVPSFWTRIGLLFAQGSPDTPFMPPALPSVTESQLASIEQQIVRTIAAHGNAVVVGRGAAHVLPRSSDVLRVYLHAPLAARVDLAMAEYGFASREAADAVARESDAARARFVRALVGRDWCDATLYDLCLDTAAVGLDGVVDVIVDLVRRSSVPTPPPAPTRTTDTGETR
jgi:CMP/dCMP kinase